MKTTTVKNIKLTRLKLSDSPVDIHCRFTLDATYEVEYDDGSIEEVEYYRIVLPINQTTLPMIENEGIGMFCYLGFGKTDILPNYKDYFWASRIIKKPDPQEMTLEELEQVVGFPFKIVKEKK